MNTNYDNSLVSGIHILKEVCYMTTSFPAMHFFYECHFFTGALEAVDMSRTPVFISQHLLQPSIITSGLWLIREKLKRIFISGKPLWSCFFKGTDLFQRTSCNKFCLKNTVLNA